MSSQNHRVHHVENPLTEPGPSHFSDPKRARPKPEGASSLESEGSHGKVLQEIPVGDQFRPSPKELQENEAPPQRPCPYTVPAMCLGPALPNGCHLTFRSVC